jgi:toxin ParE1/3/4
VSRSARRAPLARRDIVEAAQFIARDSVDAAMRFFDAVDDAIKKLAEMPGMGRLREFDAPEFRDVRSWPIKGFESYLVFYRPTPRGIEVMRVLHGARDIDAIFEGN